jgi:tetratricopeptide (TPR) repeat protein
MTASESTSPDLYSILGVDRNDPSGAIHQAFIDKLPKHPPDRDPEGFKALDLAYHTLMDPKAREEYDNLMACGGEIAELMNEAFAAMIRGRLKSAERLVGRIVDETGGASEAMMLLGMVQYEQGHYHDAIQTLGQLVDRFPRVALYRVNLGNMLMARYEHVDTTDAKKHVLKRAREQYRAAMEIDDRSPFAYVEMARTYHAEGDDETAYEWTEKAVTANGREGFEDIEALSYGAVILAEGDDIDRLRSQILRLEAVVPDEREAREYVANLLIGQCIYLVHKRKLDAVRELLLSGVRLAPEMRILRQLLEDTEIAIEANKRWDVFESDPKILIPIREMAKQFFSHFMLQSSDDRLQQAGENFFKRLDSWTLGEVRSSLEWMRNHYPSIWDLNKEFWNDLLHAALWPEPHWMRAGTPRWMQTPAGHWTITLLLLLGVAVIVWLTVRAAS